jgi:hypothetical protein
MEGVRSRGPPCGFPVDRPQDVVHWVRAHQREQCSARRSPLEGLAFRGFPMRGSHMRGPTITVSTSGGQLEVVMCSGSAGGGPLEGTLRVPLDGIGWKDRQQRVHSRRSLERGLLDGCPGVVIWRGSNGGGDIAGVPWTGLLEEFSRGVLFRDFPGGVSREVFHWSESYRGVPMEGSSRGVHLPYLPLGSEEGSPLVGIPLAGPLEGPFWDGNLGFPLWVPISGSQCGGPLKAYPW